MLQWLAVTDLLRKALNGLRALAEDRRRGAAEIADRAAAMLERYLERVQSDDPRLSYALAELAEATLRVQPSMAPLVNLANRLQLAAEGERSPVRQMRAELEKFRRHQQQASEKIARLFAARLPRRATVMTYTYSSTVLAALLAGRRRISRIIVSEARPLLEGHTVAKQLAEAGLPVTLVVDAALGEHVRAADVVVVGADAVFEGTYFNKLGTRILQEQARAVRKPFYVLADTAKFVPPALASWMRVEDKPTAEVWKEAPRGVTVVNRYFEVIPLERFVTLLCERGMMPMGRLRAWVEHMPVARRWQENPSAGGSW